MRTVLLISHAFPPSSATGAHRPLKLAKFLPAAGWRPVVLTARAQRHPFPDPSLMDLVPRGLDVHRAFSIELPVRRREPARLAGAAGAPRPRFETALRGANRRIRALLVPDDLAGWIPFAALAALGICRREGVDAIVSTAPELSNHIVAAIVSRLARRPWIADFRDPCSFNPFVPDRSARRIRLLRGIEGRVLRRATLALATTEPMAEFLRAAHPRVPPARLRVLPNGFDRDDFVGLGRAHRPGFRITHAGSLHPPRSAAPFLRGLRLLLDRTPPSEGLACDLLGFVSERDRAEIDRLGLVATVRVLGQRPYRETLAHLAASDLLLVLTGDAPGLEIYVPRKVFEYMGAGRPILAVTGEGALARFLATTGTGVVVPVGEPVALAATVEAFVEAKALGLPLTKPVEDEIREYAWPRIAERLAAYLDEAVG